MNALGYLRVMFAVDDLDETLARLRKHGAELVSIDVVRYEDSYRICYIRGPGGLLIGLAEELGCGRVSEAAYAIAPRQFPAVILSPRAPGWRLHCRPPARDDRQRSDT